MTRKGLFDFDFLEVALLIGMFLLLPLPVFDGKILLDLLLRARLVMVQLIRKLPISILILAMQRLYTRFSGTLPQMTPTTI